jgi:hypothetical protein
MAGIDEVSPSRVLLFAVPTRCRPALHDCFARVCLCHLLGVVVLVLVVLKLTIVHPLGSTSCLLLKKRYSSV